jgi:hypothetical protein
MACKTCGKNKVKTHSTKPAVRYSVLGKYKYLRHDQLKHRLEVFKRIYCKDCDDRYVCDIEMYNNCNKIIKGDK